MYLPLAAASVLGVLGCGVQGRSNVEALKVIFPLTTVKAYDVNADSVKQYTKDIGSLLDLEVIPAATPQEAVSGCDMVVTAGPILKKPHATIQAGWLDKGAFASLMIMSRRVRFCRFFSAS